jgi:hypothetical protein
MLFLKLLMVMILPLKTVPPGVRGPSGIRGEGGSIHEEEAVHGRADH